MDVLSWKTRRGQPGPGLGIAAAISALLVFGCAGEGGKGMSADPTGPIRTGPGTVDFEADVQPIFDANCSCHLSFSAPQGEVLRAGASYDSLVDVPSTERASILRVKPGDPDNSYLVIKIDDSAPDDASRRTRAGNIYVNRNMIGAVVVVQPFGGEGLSGTGPKAGGPRYLNRFATERSFSTDTTAAGGNASLLSLEEGV